MLRHRPELIGLELDAGGWADVEAVIQGARSRGHEVDRARLDQIVASSDKQRFAYSEGGTRIRANQGHSVEVELGLEAVPPPDVLFHGTIEAALPSIRAQGLVKRKRHHVHLSPDVATATVVGGRRGTPVVLEVDAAAMNAAGRAFYRSENGVWLTDHVPARFLR